MISYRKIIFSNNIYKKNYSCLASHKKENKNLRFFIFDLKKLVFDLKNLILILKMILKI